RAGLRRNHGNAHAEVGQLLLDEPGREFNGFRGDGFHGARGRVQQANGRQIAAGGIGRQRKERTLLFFFGPHRLGHRGDSRLDTDRLIMDELFLLGDHRFFAFGLADLTDTAVIARGLELDEALEALFNIQAYLFGHVQPGKAEDKTGTYSDQHQQDQYANRQTEDRLQQIGTPSPETTPRHGRQVLLPPT